MRVRYWATATACLAAGMTLAACSSSSTSTTQPTSASSAATQPAAGTSAGGATLSSGPTPTGTPVVFGFINPTSGAEPQPGDLDEANAAVYYVNHVLGGIKGRPIKLDVCNTDGTPETNVNCANGFVQSKVVAVIDGWDLSTDAELPILHSANIPLVGLVAPNVTTDQDQKSYYFGPPTEAFSVGPLQVLSQAGYKTQALTIPDSPGLRAYVADDLTPAAKRFGVTAQVDYVPTNPNWQVIATTLIADNTSLVGDITASQTDCVSLLTALRSAGWTKPVFMGPCSAYLGEMSASAVSGTIAYSGAWLPDMATYAPANIQKDLAVYAAASKAVGVTPVDSQNPVGSFSDIVTLSEILNKASAVSSGADVSTALAAVKNFPSFLGPTLTCDHKAWPGTSSCTNSFLLLQAQTDGKLKPMTSNGAFEPLTP